MSSCCGMRIGPRDGDSATKMRLYEEVGRGLWVFRKVVVSFLSYGDSFCQVSLSERLPIAEKHLCGYPRVSGMTAEISYALVEDGGLVSLGGEC